MQSPAPQPSATPATKNDDVGVVLDSAQLLGAQRELRIRHQGALYTLRVTRQDKLILTK